MNKYWKWYDNLQEPWRFLMCLVMVSPVIFNEILMAFSPYAFTIGISLTVFLVLSKMFCSYKREENEI